MSILNELKRRNVIRVGLAYLAGSWLLIQVADTVLPAYGAPAAALATLISVLVIGFVPALILAWVFEWTPEGLRRDTGRPTDAQSVPGKIFDRVVMVLLALAVAYFAVDKFVLDPARIRHQVEEAREEGRAEALVDSYGNKSIAVLPFVNMSADPEQEYFSDGIAEEILNLLARVEDLRVISRSSAFAFKGKDTSIAEIAKALRVAHVLEGSVRKSANRIRVTAQLIDTGSDTHLWSETYDRDFNDVFAIQDEIAAAVASQLQTTLLGAAPAADRADPQAYALMLHARYLLNTGTEDDVARARPLIDQALAIAPDYPPALIQKWRLLEDEGAGLQVADERRRLLQHIVAVDPDNARANILQGMTALSDGDIPTAARFLQKAMDGHSAAIEVLHMTAAILAQLGFLEEAVAIRAYIVDRDPACIVCRYMLGVSYRSAGYFDKAEELTQSAIALMPNSGGFHRPLLRTQLLNGKPQEALDGVLREPSMDSQAKALQAMALHSLGRATEAKAALADLLRSHRDEPDLYVAEALAWFGDADKVFDQLAKAGSESYIDDVFFNPFFTNVHSDPRWHELLQQHGIAPEQIAALNLRIVLPPGVMLVRAEGPADAGARARQDR